MNKRGMVMMSSNPASSSSSASTWVSTTSVSASGKRIQREMAELNTDPPLDCSAGTKGDNLYHWIEILLLGIFNFQFYVMLLTSGFGTLFIRFPFATWTPYEGGIYFLDITFPSDYPFKPPKVVFKTRIYHFDVDSVGNVSLEILKDGWSPALTITKVLIAIRKIFTEPDPCNNPLVPGIAHLYMVDKAKHDKIAAEWTLRFAK
uniref:UBC core domain-containing protein n=1 Tax=Cannabis sativa TaxID=3483 RepID=A0A803PQV0_CANSA